MKKHIKILLTVLFLTLIVCALTLGAAVSAAEADVEMPTFLMLDSTGNIVPLYSVSLEDAISQTPEGGVLALVSDYVIDGREQEQLIRIDRSITLVILDDEYASVLGMPPVSLTIIQNGANTAGFDIVSSDAKITINRGTINVVDVSEEGKRQSYPIFVSSNGADMNITLENVRTYSGSLVYSESAAVNVDIIGGEHYLLYSPAGTKTDSAWIECGGEANITAHPGSDLSGNMLPVVAFIENGGPALLSFVDGEGSGEYRAASFNATGFVFGADNVADSVISNVHANTE